ncbi:hypothetical protein [Aeromonas hydrophila]|uniref:hypothetical protein n=1 Tax=Aeromonas hydrophila TaxID=644 RepID=UPI003D237B37
MKKIGVGDSFTKQVLFDLCKKRFIFTANHGEPTIASSFVPSRLGGYIVRELICNFTFIENVMFDTYISDSKTWQNLRSLSSDIDAERDILRKIRLRVQRGRIFYEHMHTSLKLLVNEARKRGLPVQWCNDVMQERKMDFRKELNRVRVSAKRNYNPAALLETNGSNIPFDYDDLDNEA